MKIISKLLLTLALCVVASSTAAFAVGCITDNGDTGETATVGLEYMLNDEGTAYQVVGLGSVIETDIVIASKYGKNKLPVTEISNRAFERCSNLTSVIIPNSVTRIGNFAFDSCSTLTDIIIPDSVTIIGAFAFSGCSGLTNVTIGNSVTTIGQCAFADCSGLTGMVIPDSVTSMHSDTFYGCENLKRTENGIQYVDNWVVYYDKGITQATIKNGTRGIARYALDNCSSLKSIIIPDSVDIIGYLAFSYCNNLTIYCEVESQPEGWDQKWNFHNCPVVWGYKR